MTGTAVKAVVSGSTTQPDQAMTSRPSPAEAATLLRVLTGALAGVAGLAGAFTAVNVTLFATAHHVPTLIAVLLDPMVALALAVVLLADARLVTWGVPPPAWSTALRWFTATTATIMNTWTSLWPDNAIGWPRHADPAGVLLHSVPPVLLILLTETVAAYRNQIITLTTGPFQHPQPGGREHPLPAAGSMVTTGAEPTGESATGSASDPDAANDPRAVGQLGGAGPRDVVGDAVFDRALRLDAEHRSRTGRSMSIRQLKRVLRVGHARAKALRNELDAHDPGIAPRPLPQPTSAPESTSFECSQTPLDQEE